MLNSQKKINERARHEYTKTDYHLSCACRFRAHTLYAQENTTKGQGGYLSIHDKTKGLKLGARHKYDPYRRRWYTVPIRMPAPAGKPLKTHEKMILVSKGYETSFIDLRD